MSETLVKVDNVSKKFCRDLKRSLWYGMKDLGDELLCRSHNGDRQLRKDEFWAVKDVSFELKRGECLGLIGRNGAGKTTLLRMLNGLIKPDKGRIEMRGRVGALIALGAGFNPVLTGRENIYVNAAVLGLSKKETDMKFDSITSFAELHEFIDAPILHYSTGMFVRLAFAVAASFEPDILLVDEALAVGDLAFTIKCLNRIAELRKAGTCVIFVSHSELQVREAAKSCFLMHKGTGYLFDTPNQAFLAYDSFNSDGGGAQNSDISYVHNGPINVRYEGCYGSPNDSLPRTGETISILMESVSEESFNEADLEVRFWNSKGQLISTIRSSIANKLYDLPKGRSVFRITIHDNALAPGRYRLAGGFRRNGEILGWARDFAHIEILPSVKNLPSTGLVFQNAEISGPFPLY